MGVALAHWAEGGMIRPTACGFSMVTGRIRGQSLSMSLCYLHQGAESCLCALSGCFRCSTVWGVVFKCSEVSVPPCFPALGRRARTPASRCDFFPSCEIFFKNLR